MPLFALGGADTVQTVAFSGLGLTFQLNRVAFVALGRPIYWYGVIIATGMILAVVLCSRWSVRFGLDENQFLDLLLFAVPVALVAVRIYYVVFNLQLYRLPDGTLDWGAIFRYSDGGLAIYGAILSSIVVLLIFCRVRKIDFFAFADLGVHGLLIGQLIGRWGNFMNVEAYGAPTTVLWRMSGPSIARDLFLQEYIDEVGYQHVMQGTLGVHPTFFYESMWNLIGLFLVYRIGKKRKFDGQCFLFYIFWYGLGRAWIEGLRTDSLYFFGLTLLGAPIRVSQLLAAVSCIAAGAVLLYKLSLVKKTPQVLYVDRLLQMQAMETAQEKSSDQAENAENAENDPAQTTHTQETKEE